MSSAYRNFGYVQTMWRWLAAGMVWLAPTIAPAQTAPGSRFALAWTAPSGCPSEADVENEIQRLLGASTAPLGGPRVLAEARVTSTSGGFELALTLSQSEATRTRRLAAPTCQELGKAAGLVVALAVDPSLATTPATEPEAPGTPAPCPEAVPASNAPPPAAASCPPCPAPPPPPVASPPSRTGGSVGLVAGVSASYGALPGISPRPLFGARYRLAHHQLELSLGATFTRSAELEAGRVATFRQWYAAPRYCLGTSAGRAQVGGCVSAELGWIVASGFGVDEPRTQHEWWLALGPGVQAALPLKSAGAEVLIGADLLLAPSRPRFELAGTPVFTPHLLLPGLRLALIGELF